MQMVIQTNKIQAKFLFELSQGGNGVDSQLEQGDDAHSFIVIFPIPATTPLPKTNGIKALLTPQFVVLLLESNISISVVCLYFIKLCFMNNHITKQLKDKISPSHFSIQDA